MNTIECPYFEFKNKTEFINILNILNNKGYKLNMFFGENISSILKTPETHLKWFDYIIIEPSGICFTYKGNKLKKKLTINNTVRIYKKYNINVF